MAATKSATSSQTNSPFIKQLASSNRTERDRALSSLRTYLSRSKPFPRLELLKLWKGLFFCMFMSDKPRNQQQLARDLAALTDVLRDESTKLAWLEAFWQTMASNWNAIDSLRMDKYLYLVRCYVSKGFELLKQRKWSEEWVEKYTDMLAVDGAPLSARDPKVPRGLTLHVLDVWMDELEKVDQEKQALVVKIMKPIRLLALRAECPVKSVNARAVETMKDDRLLKGKEWRAVDDASDEARDSDAPGRTDE